MSAAAETIVDRTVGYVDFNNADERSGASVKLLHIIAEQLVRLNDNLEAGAVNVRTHHPLCVAPKGTGITPASDYTIRELDVMGKFLNTAIAEGRLVLPPGEGARS